MRYWVAVVSRDHVLRGVAGGYCQIGHGKAWPLRKMAPGDGIIYYSSKLRADDPEPCRRFTAVGTVRPGEPYEFELSPSFTPFRRDVDFLPAAEADISPLIDRLAFIVDKKRWGYPFRLGFLEISSADFALIADAMRAPRAAVPDPT